MFSCICTLLGTSIYLREARILRTVHGFPGWPAVGTESPGASGLNLVSHVLLVDVNVGTTIFSIVVIARKVFVENNYLSDTSFDVRTRTSVNLEPRGLAQELDWRG